MMIVDLIDGEDFRRQLVALGIRIPEGSCPDTCARMALRRYIEVGVPGLQSQVQQWMQHTDIMLPSVRQAIERFLLPGLR
ncbi:hypothetical protein [Aidingimonas lacisalsi]|uniref:hypothetical protein n=1 Tax=Aidingimonas lacisalsi TaxID=2604086 RepID=UPI0011D19600|nr:hypothetical protein [Aidingimonas lacisalsi]